MVSHKHKFVSLQKHSGDSKYTPYYSINYCKDTDPLYHSFMYSLVSIFFPVSMSNIGETGDIYPLPAMHSLLVTKDARNK